MQNYIVARKQNIDVIFNDLPSITLFSQFYWQREALTHGKLRHSVQNLFKVCFTEYSSHGRELKSHLHGRDPSSSPRTGIEHSLLSTGRIDTLGAIIVHQQMLRAIDSNKSVEIKFSVHDTILESLSSGTLIVK